jgi:hypothetical protein
LPEIPNFKAKLTLKGEIMQELIQPLEQNNWPEPDEGRAPVTQPGGHLMDKDKLSIVPPARDSLSQDYNIQDDMKGLAGKLGGLFGM